MVSSSRGGTIGCELTLTAAKVIGIDEGPEYSIQLIECPVNAETVRRLLGQLGGFATKCDRVTK